MVLIILQWSREGYRRARGGMGLINQVTMSTTNKKFNCTYLPTLLFTTYLPTLYQDYPICIDVSKLTSDSSKLQSRCHPNPSDTK